MTSPRKLNRSLKEGLPLLASVWRSDAGTRLSGSGGGKEGAALFLERWIERARATGIGRLVQTSNSLRHELVG